jgi:peptidoglycan hydrolase-like protein with peptidoglycan-binding domain
MSRRGWIRVAVVAGLAVAAAAVGAATLGLGGPGSGAATPRRTGPAATATVTRQTLVESVTLLGQVGYGAAVPLTAAAPGTVTWLPEPGATIRRGEVVLRADEQPVVLLYGTIPMYRSLAVGAKGADVRQLEENLAALGRSGFTVDDSFTPATTVAVKRWQRDLGLTGTGAVEAHRVVFAPGPVRVAQRLVRPGATATGDVLAVTGGVRVVTVTASAGEASWATVDARVTVGLPGDATTPGRVGAVTAAAPGGASGAGPAGDGPDNVDITVALTDQAALDRLESTVRLDGAPVRVTYVVRQRVDVLTVPVTALLALAEGGYGLEVVTADGPRIVAVEVGLFADGRVEVTGAGLAEGMTVGVPGE